ncbi:S-adenosyl-L-methionine-dependent methyltransferase, partial [Mycena sp. CBHHK59/15]
MLSFFPTRQISYTQHISAPLSTVLQLIHDPPALMHLSPLIVSVSVDPKDPAKHTIVDDLCLFGFRTKMTYFANITIHEDGMTADVAAGAGTRTETRYAARAVPGGTEVEEKCTINAFFLFMPFIVRTVEKAHSQSLERLAASVTKIWCRSADPYGLFHLTLNRLPLDDPAAPPRTEWLNMGYWRDTDVFPDACQALALKLIQAARCKPGGKVLDVGHGSGESLILLLTHPSVPRPSCLNGITSLESHYRRSQARVARLDQDVPVVLHAGDAIYRAGCIEHPLDPSSDEHFDTILALDCAYHFQPRTAFLRQSYDRVLPGGSVALADICFAPSALQTRWTRLVTALLRLMPRQNLVSTDEYLAQMRTIGYVDVELEDITEDVFPGFIKFLRKRGFMWWAFGRILGAFAGAGARFVVVRGKRDGSSARQ